MSLTNCTGCGCLFQSEDEKLPGYINSNLLNKKESKDLKCKRCFRILNYNEFMKVSIDNDMFNKSLSNIACTNALFVYVVDIFDLNGSIIDNFNRLTSNNDVILVANKVDVLPKSIKHSKLKLWLRNYFVKQNLEFLSINITSSKTSDGIEKLLEDIRTLSKGRDVYIVGCANVGKSSLINNILNNSTFNYKNSITTSKFSGTTLDLIKIPFDNNHIIDTPGIIKKDQFINYIDLNVLDKIVPKNEIKSKVYQLNSGQSIIIGGFVSFNFIKGDKRSFILYFNNNIYIHRTKSINLEKIFNNNLGKLLSPTYSDFENVKFITKSFKLGEGKFDIVVSGLGFITVKGNITIEIKVHNKVDIFIREALI